MIKAPSRRSSKLAADLVDEWTDFVIEHDNGKVMPTGTRADKWHLIGHHFANNTLVCHRDFHGEVDGIMMWNRWKSPVTLDDITEWRPDDYNGNVIVVGWMLSLCKYTTNELIRTAITKVDDWHMCQICGIRNGKIKPYPNNVVRRMLYHLI